MDKSPDAFRTISEVAVDLDLPQHVLRFWETRFAQIKPLKRGGGRRYYRPDDVELLKGIRHLLYSEGYTIRGVQRILKDQGVRFVMNVWQDGAPQPAAGERGVEAGRAEPSFGLAEADDEVLFDDGFDGDSPEHPTHPVSLDRRATRVDPAASNFDGAERDGWAPQARREPVFRDAPDHAAHLDATAAAMAQRFAPRLDTQPGASDPHRAEAIGVRRADSASPPHLVVATPGPGTSTPAPVARATEIDRGGLGSGLPQRVARVASGAMPQRAIQEEEFDEPSTRSPLGTLIDRFRPQAQPVRNEAEAVPAPRPAASLSREEVRRLQATLFELLECKRLLDQAR